MKNKLSLMFVIANIFIPLSACGGSAPAPPLPTPQVVTVAHTPPLLPVSTALHACAITLPEIALVVNETSLPYLWEKAADLYLWMGEPPEGTDFAYLLAEEQIIFIVNPDNPIQALNPSELGAIFNGQTRNWPAVGGANNEIEVWVYPKSDEVQQLIEAVLLNGRAFTSQARMAPDPAAMLEAVSDKSQAIGFLPRAWISEGVKTVDIVPGLRPLLKQPLLALSNVEPQGGARALLLCLQGETGQAALRKRYESENEE